MKTQWFKTTIILLILFQSIFGQIDRTRGGSSYSSDLWISADNAGGGSSSDSSILNNSWISPVTSGGGNSDSWISADSGITRNIFEGSNSSSNSEGSTSSTTNNYSWDTAISNPWSSSNSSSPSAPSTPSSPSPPSNTSRPSNNFVSSASGSSPGGTNWSYASSRGINRHFGENSSSNSNTGSSNSNSVWTNSVNSSPPSSNNNSNNSNPSSNSNSNFVNATPPSYSTGSLNNNWALEPSSNAYNYTTPIPEVRPLGSLNINVSSIKEIGIKNDPKYGPYLVNGKGFTLYGDTKNKDTIACYNQCEKTWPPAIITSTQQMLIDDGVNGNVLFSMNGTDGRSQLVYNHYALYYYILDVQPGQKRGMGLEDRFYLISPLGNPIIVDNGGNVNTDSNIPSPVADNSLLPNTITNTLDGRHAILVNGVSQMDIVPDLYTLRFTYSISNSDLQTAFLQIEKAKSDLTNSLSSSDSIKLILINKKISHKDSNFLIAYDYEISSKDSQNLANISNKIQSGINSNPNANFSFYFTYSVSPDSINSTKAQLYSKAVNNALNNLHKIIDPLNLKIDRINPIRSITVKSPDLERINPIFDKISKTLFPSFIQINEITVDAKVSVEFNLL